MPLFESYDRREANILAVLKKYGINTIEECREICQAKGFDPYKITEETQPICFENAKWAYTVGAAIAIKKGCTKAADAAEAIGEGLQSFCINGSVADNRKVGLGHGNLAAMLLRDETESTASARMPPTSSPASTASPTSRPSSIRSRRRSRWSMRSPSPTVPAPRSSATARTTFRKA